MFIIISTAKLNPMIDDNESINHTAGLSELNAIDARAELANKIIDGSNDELS